MHPGARAAGVVCDVEGGMSAALDAARAQALEAVYAVETAAMAAWLHGALVAGQDADALIAALTESAAAANRVSALRRTEAQAAAQPTLLNLTA